MADIIEFPTKPEGDWEVYRKIIKKRYNESAVKFGLPDDIAETICERLKDDFLKYTSMIGEIHLQVQIPDSLSAEEKEIIYRSIETARKETEKMIQRFFNEVIADRAETEWRIFLK